MLILLVEQITIDFVREASKRFISAYKTNLVTIDNIQRTVAEYYKIKVADLLIEKTKPKSVARPRQIAMALC